MHKNNKTLTKEQQKDKERNNMNTVGAIVMIPLAIVLAFVIGGWFSIGFWTKVIIAVIVYFVGYGAWVSKTNKETFYKYN